LTGPIKDQECLSGPLVDVLEKLDTKLEAHLTAETDLTSKPTEIVRADYPLAALQQIARNAILHRTYESTNTPVRITWFNDRIEVLSPGGPFGNVTSENFGAPGVTDYRNPHLAEAMRNLGYVQKFGVGIPIARSELARNGNPQLEFDLKPNFICCTIRKRP
jgi:ATP-dependent DNA helicase RecG